MARRHRSMPRALANPRTARTARRSESARRGALWFRVGLAGALLAIAVLGTIAAAGAHNSKESRVGRKVEALLAGIPQEGQTLGAPTAPVTLQLFADLEDRSSDEWFLTYLPTIASEFVRTDILRIEYRSFKTNTIDSETFVKQQAAALAAGAQDRFWNYVYTFYYEQGKEYSSYVTEGYLDNIARQVPALNIKRWGRDRDTDSRIEQVVEEDQQGRADGIHTTPGYRIGLTGRTLHNFAGSNAITYPGQIHPTTFASAEDIAKAVDQIR